MESAFFNSVMKHGENNGWIWRGFPRSSMIFCGRAAALAIALHASCYLMASTNTIVRDPFWPLGYEPPKPEKPQPKPPPKPLTPAKPRQPPQPEPPKIEPITQTDWDLAQRLLTISGTIRSIRPDTGETRAQIMINRQTYVAGDALVMTNRDIRFVWRVAPGANRNLTLERVKADRLEQ